MQVTFFETEEVTRNATLIQHWFRWQKARRCHHNLKSSIVALQAMHRGGKVRLEYHKTMRAAVIVQRACRTFLDRIIAMRKRLLQASIAKSVEVTTAVNKIQRWYRRCRVNRLYLRLQNAVSVIHATHKETVDRNRRQSMELDTKIQSTLIIQKLYRNYRTRCSFLNKKRAAILIQSRYRGSKARKLYLQKLNSIVILQSFARMLVTRMDYLLQQELMDYESFQNR